MHRTLRPVAQNPSIADRLTDYIRLAEYVIFIFFWKSSGDTTLLIYIEKS